LLGLRGGGSGFLRLGTGADRRQRLPHFGFCFEAVQFVEGAVIVALAGVDHPLEALEEVRVGGEGVGGIAGLGFRMLGEEGVGGVLPEDGFDAAHAAEAPLVCNERIDEETLVGIGGAVVFVVFGGELGEIAGGFVEHDLVNGDDAVLHGVVAGCGLALSGAVTGGF
jgi:hypothetical protein